MAVLWKGGVPSIVSDVRPDGTWIALGEHEEIAMNKEKGAVGYILMWLMGVPASVLFLIFLLRGCN
jgi:hypothetical protein